MPKYRLIIDIATDRVLFFTSDFQQSLHTDERSAQCTFDGELPQGMTQLNSTDFKYLEKSLKSANNYLVQPVLALDLNKKSLMDFLEKCVSEKIKSLSDSSVERLTYAEAQIFLNDNSKPSRWLSLLIMDQQLTLVQVAEQFSQQYEQKIDILYRVECVRQRWIKTIQNTDDAQQLFTLPAIMKRDFNIGVFSDER